MAQQRRRTSNGRICKGDFIFYSSESGASESNSAQGDTHGSKAVPPRFKDHTKLVCARHSRSGRKKYVKKHPDRVRKVPSRKVGKMKH